MGYLLYLRRFLIKTLDLTLKCGIIVLMGFILSNAVILETRYMAKYENSWAQTEREHERQLVVGAVIQSQHAWERQGKAMTTAYYEAKAQRDALKKDLFTTASETYHILRKLEELYPEIHKKVMEKNKLPLRALDIFKYLEKKRQNNGTTRVPTIGPRQDVPAA